MLEPANQQFIGSLCIKLSELAIVKFASPAQISTYASNLETKELSALEC